MSFTTASMPMVPALRCAAALALVAAAGCRGGERPAEAPAGAAAPAASASKPAPVPVDEANRVIKEGLQVEFSLVRPGDLAASTRPLLVGEHAEARFRITDAATGQPVQGKNPAAWLDLSGPAGQQTPAAAAGPQCKEKIGIFLQGVVGMRPMVDLNSYFVLVLNREPSISVVDPIVGITGRTNLYTSILLKKPAADWAKSANQERIYVSMPVAGEIAVVDTESFKVLTNVAAGRSPTRVAFQPDGKYLWVGNDAPLARESGVTVIDAEKLAPVASIATGRGHHEIAFSGDGRLAFVTNREEGTVSVVDVAKLRKVKNVATGPLPISIVFSPAAGLAYVADGTAGDITAIDAKTLEVAKRIRLEPGLGPMRFSQDGRWIFVVNTAKKAVHVIDAGDDRVAHTLELPGTPYQLAFSRDFAYVRLLDSERVQLVNLSTLGHGKAPHVQAIPIGTKGPEVARDLGIADTISPASTEAAVFVTSPGDAQTYYYMEGMNAPAGSYGGYGHGPRAVMVVDRSLREIEPGVYAANVRVPAAGKFDVGFLLENPRIVHCFSAETQPNPAIKPDADLLDVEYVYAPPRLPPGDHELRFRLVDPSKEPRAGIRDVRVRYFLAHGTQRADAAAREIGDGVYAVNLHLPREGVYYVHFGAPSLRLEFGELPHHSVVVARAPSTTADQRKPRGKQVARGR